MVGNQLDSIDVSFELYHRRPIWLTYMHDPKGPFTGETSLHILAANKREVCRHPAT